jgi:two-component system, NtrC family, sensor kinase
MLSDVCDTFFGGYMAERSMVVFPSKSECSTADLSGLVSTQRLATVSQEQQRQFPLLDYDQDLVAVCDFNGFLVSLNPIGRELMGVGPAEDLSLFQVRCFTPLTQDLWNEIFTSLVNEGLWSGEHILQYAADPVVVKLLVIAHRPDPEQPETIDCFSIVARVQENMIERKVIEAALKSKTEYLQQALSNLQQARTHMVQAEKMSSLGQLVAGIAHEINNPVNFIYGNLKYVNEYINDLLGLLNQYRRVYPQPVAAIQTTIEAVDLDYLLADLPKMLGSMQVGADRIRAIVLSLRNFSRLDESEFKAADLHQGIDSTLMILQNRIKPQENWPGVQIVQELDALPLVPCFAGQLNQVLMNLLVNAIDALETAYAEGIVTQPTIQIRTQIVGAMVQIQFQDNGPGIPADIQSRLFDPFFTTKPVGKGTGMGLAISYQIIHDRHHGCLSVASEPGQGTTFTVEIPLQQSPISA